MVKGSTFFFVEAVSYSREAPSPPGKKFFFFGPDSVSIKNDLYFPPQHSPTLLTAIKLIKARDEPG